MIVKFYYILDKKVNLFVLIAVKEIRKELKSTGEVLNFIESESCKSSLVAPAMALNTTLHPTAANSAGELNVRHRSEVVNKRKSIWVEVIRRHTAPLEQDGLYGAKQLATVFLLEVNISLKRI